MKLVFSIFIMLFSLGMIGCSQQKVVCGFTYSLPEGTGLESKLKRFEMVAMMDTAAAMIDIEITYLFPVEGQKENPAIGVNVLVKKLGTEEFFAGAVTDIDGQLKLFFDPGKYDIEFSYVGCNTLLVKNATFGIGEMKKVVVILGGQGKDRKTFEVDLEKG